MQLKDMPLIKSFDAQEKIMIIIGEMLKDKNVARVIEELYKPESDKAKPLALVKSRVKRSSDALNVFGRDHLDETAKILSILNDKPVEDIKASTRGDFENMLGEMVSDSSLMPFFLSSIV